ncbi:MAG: DUF2442 domain-containing protein [Fibrobacterota bacterium]
MKPIHAVKDVKIASGKLSITIDGRRHVFELASISPCLLKADDAARNVFEISASGYGIHWPLLDEDLSIDGLLGIVNRPTFDTKRKQRVNI